MIRITITLESAGGKDRHEHTFFTSNLTLDEIRLGYGRTPNAANVFTVRLHQGPYEQTIRYEELTK